MRHYSILVPQASRPASPVYRAGFAEGGLDVVFLFGEGAEGVGVVDDGFASGAPVERVVRREIFRFC